MSAKPQTADSVRNYLAYGLAGSFVGIIPLFVFWGMPNTSKDIVTYMVGQLSGMATMALGYFFTTRPTSDKPVPVEVTNPKTDPVPVKGSQE